MEKIITGTEYELAETMANKNIILSDKKSTIGFCPKINAPCRNDCISYHPARYGYGGPGYRQPTDKTAAYLSAEYCDYVADFCAVDVNFHP